MKMILTSYRGTDPVVAPLEEVVEVEFSPQVEQWMTGREDCVQIRMAEKTAIVKLRELRAIIEAAERLI